MKTSHRRLIAWIAGGAAAAAICTGGTVIGLNALTAAQTSAATSTPTTEHAWYRGPSGSSGSSGSAGGYGAYGYGPGSSDSSGSSTSTTTTATAAQQRGIVVIDTTLAYEQAQAAGTGIVLTSSGEILTNNHVVAGATSIQVTVPATGATYTATVVGTDATDDVAVLQLQGASGLATATLDSGGGAATGDTVTAVGNAGGTGTLVQSTGTVTATDASITTQAEGAAASESLSGLIETDAGVVAGDSGGPLYDSTGEVVGIDTAASSNTSVPDGYAIPIATALSIAHRIETGQASSTIVIGASAFLGVAIQDTPGTAGALIAGVYDGTPAASAGLAAGDVVTAVDGTAVTSASDLSAALSAHKPGDTVRLSWTDAAGTAHTGTATLISGPAA